MAQESLKSISTIILSYIKININRETSNENGISHILMAISGSCGQIAYAYTRS